MLHESYCAKNSRITASPLPMPLYNLLLGVSGNCKYDVTYMIMLYNMAKQIILGRPDLIKCAL